MIKRFLHDVRLLLLHLQLHIAIMLTIPFLQFSYDNPLFSSLVMSKKGLEHLLMKAGFEMYEEIFYTHGDASNSERC